MAERAPLHFVDWDRNGDPDLYLHSHLVPVPVGGEVDWGRRDWIFYGSDKFSGQRIQVAPGRTAPSSSLASTASSPGPGPARGPGWTWSAAARGR